jgi:CubicO group peptidase (beta-lactamase class C family)
LAIQFRDQETRCARGRERQRCFDMLVRPSSRGLVFVGCGRRLYQGTTVPMKKLLTTTFALVVATAAQAQLPPTFADWDNFVEQQMKLWNVPGFSIAIVHDGNVVLSRGGSSELAQRSSAAPRT